MSKPNHSADLKKQFLDLYEGHADALFRFTYYKLSDREKAKDMVQDTFVKVWEYLSAGGEVQNIRALMYKIASNAIIDNYRKRKDISLEILIDDGFDPADHEEAGRIINKADGAAALKLLNNLDDNLRDILLLRYVDGLSVQEIAAITEERENTISVKIHRALKELGVMFEQKTEQETEKLSHQSKK